MKFSKQEQTIIKKWFKEAINENNFKDVVFKLQEQAAISRARFSAESWDWTFKEKHFEKKYIKTIDNLAAKIEKHFTKVFSR